MPSISGILGQQGQTNPSNMMVLSNTTTNSLNNAALWLSGDTGSVIIDSAAQKRIAWNDDTGSLTIRSGNYVSANGNIFVKKSTDANGGAASVILNSDEQNGSIEFKVANIGAPGDIINYNTTLTISTVGASINNSPIVTVSSLKTVNGTTIVGPGDLLISAVPAQTGNSGKYLTTNGTVASWSSLGSAAIKNAPATGNAAMAEVVLGNDSRLSDARTPVSHAHAISDITNLQAALDSKSTNLNQTTTAVSKTLSANELCVITANNIALTPPAAVSNARFGVIIPSTVSGTYLNGTGTTIMGFLDEPQFLLDLYDGKVGTYMFRYNSITGWTLE